MAYEGSEGSGLLATVLRSSRGEDGGELANEAAGSPERASLVEEGGNLSRRAPIASGEAENELLRFRSLVNWHEKGEAERKVILRRRTP
jgi:hypothetical protein